MKCAQHYGKLMFENALQLARARGMKYLWLEVLEQNAGGRRFYEKQGMRYIRDTIFSTPSQQSRLNIMGMPV
ncbi:GNAT family N-acetyltransferase [Pantoea sp. FN060301]|uniref:GNAT family N-acetyltransferase n=1 Tax=Pantoea sp. FN060301 TaxID=3420380 RepID=UPI003D17AEB0